MLLIGGLFLCFEGYEKLHSMIVPHDGHGHGDEAEAPQDPHEFENQMVSGAIRTDFILSAEIMALTLATVADAPLLNRALVLGLVGIGITLAVYGLVAVIVKADDAGAAMVRTKTPGLAQLGWALVKGMPKFLAVLSVVGTLAMLWVGGDIVLHSLAHYGFDAPEHLIKDTAKHIANCTTCTRLFRLAVWCCGLWRSGGHTGCHLRACGDLCDHATVRYVPQAKDGLNPSGLLGQLSALKRHTHHLDARFFEHMARQFIYHMQGLSKTYAGGKKVLDNVHLSFYPDAKIGVLGPNGSGKSTLLRIMAGLDKEWNGEAWLAEGATCGYLEQEPQLDPIKAPCSKTSWKVWPKRRPSSTNTTP